MGLVTNLQVHPLLPINSSSVFSIWLLVSFMFTKGSSAILTAVGDHLFAIGLFPLATCFETRHCGDYSKEARRTKSRGDKSVKQSHMVTFPLQQLASDRLLCPNASSLSLGFDSKRGQSIHLQYFAFYKPIKCWSHRDRSSSNCG